MSRYKNNLCGLTLFHVGGEEGVTGSSHLLIIEGRATIMVDCGAAMGHDRVIPFLKMPVPVNEIDYLFITHAHHDHIGRIPDLIEAGFCGEIICTHGTKALLLPMLQDAMAFSDRSKPRVRELERQIDELSWGFEYDQAFKLKRGITFKLRQAGHILGSCFIRFEIPEWTGRNSPKQRCRLFSIIFSGDLGCENTPILPDPDLPESCDVLVLESTYGDRNHQHRDLRIENLGLLLTRALQDRGKVFIPAFALGRTQELIYEMDRVFSDEKWKKRFPKLNGDKKIPVFVDSPLGLQITKIYASVSEFWDKEARDLLKSGDHPIDFNHLYAVENHRNHQKLCDMPGPAIILAGSGMCTGGRIIGHLENGLESPENDLFFVGYQARGTTGRDILKYSRRSGGYIRINGRKIKIRAKVHTLTGYSAHADQNGLLKWVASMPEKPGKIKLVHGDLEAKGALKRELEKKGHRVEL